MRLVRPSFLSLGIVLCGSICFLPGTARALDIAQIEALNPSTATALDSNPVITFLECQPGTFNGYTYTQYNFIVNDGTGSMSIFENPPLGTYVPTVGDAISVAGTYSIFHNRPELTSLTSIAKVSSGNPVPPLTHVTIAQLLALNHQNFDIEEYHLELDNVTFVSPPAVFPSHTTAFYSATDGTNAITIVLGASGYSETASLAGMAVPTGPVNLTGFADVNGTPEFFMFGVQAVPEPSTITLLVVGAVGLLIARRSYLAGNSQSFRKAPMGS